jgi:hypothetical protein
VEKGLAVTWLLNKLRAERGVFPVIGLGDSLSDHRFMKLCSWYGIPRQSQFAEAVSMKILENCKMQPLIPFSGSYDASDVQFLLKPIEMEMTPVDQKEALIQSGKKHYSDMLSQEPAPTSWHLDLFSRTGSWRGPTGTRSNTTCPRTGQPLW